MKTKELIPTGHDLEIKAYASDSLRLGPKTGSRSKLAAFTISANLEAAIALSESKPIGLAPTAGMSVTRRDRIVIFKNPETYYVGRAIGDPLLIDHKGMRPPLWQVAAHEGALYIVVEPIALFKEAMSQRGRRPRPLALLARNRLHARTPRVPLSSRLCSGSKGISSQGSPRSVSGPIDRTGNPHPYCSGPHRS
jgi:type IV secretory pathway protease TraF